MSSVADRLRGVVMPRGSEPRAAVADLESPGENGPDAAAVLGGEWRQRCGQRFLVIDRCYSPGYQHGNVPIADTVPQSAAGWPQLPLLAGSPCQGRMLFLDLETTGLAGGAGTYAFLVGCAWFDSAVFHTRQLFLSSFAAERVLLEALIETFGDTGTLITYNGKSFDVPLLDTRFVFHRMETPFAALAHVDMVHPARRMWRDDEDGEDGFVRQRSCRLSALESALFGHRRDGDVPGFEIPSRYFHYVRTGDARGLAAVMEHNRLDLLSLAIVTARASQLLEQGAEAARTAREAFGLGRIYERAGLIANACAAFERAADLSRDSGLTAEALRAYAVLCRRERRYEQAAAAWRRILDSACCPPQITSEAITALAVHHEHRLRDPRSARTLAMRSLAIRQTVTQQRAVEHRLARLDRKLNEAAAAGVLF